MRETSSLCVSTISVSQIFGVLLITSAEPYRRSLMKMTGSIRLDAVVIHAINGRFGATFMANKWFLACQ